VQEKIKTMMAAFPQIFMVNQNVLFEDFVDAYGEDSSRYDLTPPVPEESTMGLPTEKAEKTPLKVGAGAGLPPLPA
jgi:hypothetical protein